MENQEQLQDLLEKYRNHRCSPQEVKQLLGYFQKDSIEQDQLMELVLDHLKALPAVEQLGNISLSSRLDQAFLNIREEIDKSQTKSRSTRLLWKKILAAATVTIIVGVSSLYYINKTKSSTDHSLQAHDILPGGHKARLTLADGKTIELDNTQSGIVIGENSISYNDGTAISAKKNNETISISTPKGGEYKVVLSDGSKVWLNAATTLQYSANLRARGKRRVMLVDGEAYFEVAKDKNRPFVVLTKTQEVEVLGTHFNVSSYADQRRTVTTLEEGSVKVSSISDGTKNNKDLALKAPHLRNEVVLKPGQQSLSSDGKLRVQEADMQSALAWKEGMIYFRDAPIQEVLRQISLWYNIEIEYEGVPTKEVFNGGVKRTSDLSAVLRILELSNVHCRVQKKNNKKILTILQKK
ncbi:FecR family protein [Chryseobacterium herbae]|uniref:FecR domain-containing protein n=1 Tax=Chryseobacterium herbae TaxID=2976476 RepID=A0ABT2ISM9_9FLAO|nr:FecR family protein [Chryseobacterium sp. pc1-10]MCT2561833.1 FecR domain-containing protein [Chryseobacterium sp. pc1-10]